MIKSLLKVFYPVEEIPELKTVQQTRAQAKVVINKIKADLDNGHTTDSWFIRVRKPQCEIVDNDNFK